MNHEISLKHAAEQFLDQETVGKSIKTARWYKARLRLILPALGEEHPIASINSSELIDWHKELALREAGGELSVDTIHGYIRACKRFFGWAYETGYTENDLAQYLRLPRLPQRGKKGISDSNARAILNAAKENTRDFAIISLLESTGARRGGVANLKISDLNLDAPDPRCRQAIVLEKGDRERVVIMSKKALNALRAWLAKRKTETEYVFVGPSGKPLTPDGISEIVERYKKKLGIKGPCSPHQWRHRWCRRMTQKGMPLNQVSQLAGHKSIVVTAMFYGMFAVNELQEAYDKYYD